MVVLECVESKEKCRRENGMGHCPFPALCRDLAVVSRQEGHGMRTTEELCAHMQA